MNVNIQHRQMIEVVAKAIGENLLRDVAFVGGCTTGLLLDDPFSMEQVRHTYDVDLIVHVVGRVEWYSLQRQLQKQGFRETMGDSPICTMKLGELCVDFMPDDQAILGFCNKWYEDALKTAEDYKLTESTTIRLVLPVYFLATKFEAYLGRGGNDPLGSQDMEDILTLLDGRSTIVSEVQNAPNAVKQYISEKVLKLIDDRNFEFAVHGAANGDAARESLIFERVEQMT
jgi:predicted nucleotidyltransferase